MFPLFLFLLTFLSPQEVTGSHHPVCSPPNTSASSASGPAACPPFRSVPAIFPYSFATGCGHPSFQIWCSSPHSLISINASLFLLLDQSPTSLLLSPSSPLLSPSSLSCPSLPYHPISFAGTPFHLAANTCDHLHSLRFCPAPPSNFSATCRLTSFQNRILSQPSLLLSACSLSNLSNGSSPVHAPCGGDIPNSILGFLRAGFQVEWNPSTDTYYRSCKSCNGVCGFNNSASSKPFLCFHSSAAASPTAPPAAAARRLLLLTTILFAVACFIVLLLLYFCTAAALRRHRRSCRLGCAAEPMAAFLRRHHLHPPVFSYEQLRTATSGFDPRRKIGDGGFGSVYLADLGGRAAAVKRLHRHHPEAASAATTTKSFCNEILILSSLRHPNLVRLHGYCADPRGLLLVYDYVPNGTLSDHLYGIRRTPAGLPWTVRADVAFQIALALEYLHFGVKPPVVHRDVTSCNIFVETDMQVRLGDFGLSRLLTFPDACSLEGSRELVCCTGPQGTPGYLDPEYHRSFRLTEKSDIYSFGVVLLELVTGMRAVDVKRERREIQLVDLVVGKIQIGELRQVVDPVLLKEEEREGVVMGGVEAVAELAFQCVAGDKDDRPDARELVEELKRIKGNLC